ncbi:MAG: PQQ-dependent sugar dehydrogenase [Algibacter sp.]
MRIKLLSVCFVFIQLSFSQTPITSGIDWSVSNLTSNNALNSPNTILYGPDNYLWITEREGKKVVKVNPQDGSITEMLDLTGAVFQSVTQDGLMGMAIHPDLYSNITTTNNYVYLVYTYDSDPTATENIKLRIARYTYNSGTGILNPGSATVIIDDIEAGSDHNSGKLTIGPDYKLYWTIGDFGANRSTRACTEIKSQYLPTTSSDYSVYKGKILRLNLDGTIPSDNPTLNSIKSHVYSYGHRNAQGIVFGSNGTLYSSEHGDKTDDEINIITSGKNYGWPLIAGYNDDKGYGYCNWSSYPSSCGSYDSNSCPGSYISEATSAAALTDFQPPIGTLNSTPDTEPTGSWLTWPTVAPASIAIYESGLIPGWEKSLLIPTLKTGTIFRTKLDASGLSLEDSTYEEFHSSDDRYRDIAIDPDGVTLYAITDNNSNTNPGVVMKIEYSGTTLSNSTIETTKLSLLPNPAKNEVKLNLGLDSSSFNIKIIDALGRTIKNKINIKSGYTLNTTHFLDGVYFVSAYNKINKTVITKKLIIQH